MTVFYNKSDAIDGERVHIKSKKFVPAVMFRSKTGFKGIKYKCSRGCYANIVKELDLSIRQSLNNNQSSIHFDINDELQCEALFFIAETAKHIDKCLEVTMMSGRHECMEGTPDCRLYAEIEYPFEHIINALINKQSFLKQCDDYLLK